MKTLTRIFAMAAIGFGSICAFVNPASAQNAFQGSFTLSHEIRWQSAVLPAGDYTFAMESAAVPCKMIVRGPNGTSFELSRYFFGVSASMDYLRPRTGEISGDDCGNSSFNGVSDISAANIDFRRSFANITTDLAFTDDCHFDVHGC